MKQSFNLFAVLSIAILSACGSSSEDPNSPNSPNAKKSGSSYRYKYCYNCSDLDGCFSDNSKCSAGGCTTGEKTATSLQAHCDNLKDHSANNYCAKDSRETSFKDSKCTGSF